MNRIQFQAGMSLNQFLTNYGNVAQCETALENFVWLVSLTLQLGE